MPPEASTWDRKDLFKQKKNERLDALGSVVRWRDSHHGSRDFVRWGSDEFRRPQGHGKQGGYQLFSEDSDYGCTILRSSERIADDDTCRFPASRAEAKYGRNSRENKGFLSQKDWKGHISERDTDGTFSSSGRQHEISAQRSVDDLLTYASHPHSDNENSSLDLLNYKDHHDKMGGVDGLGTGYRYDKDHSFGSITWKPLKWTRSGSLSSRGSGFSHSSSSRSITADSVEMEPELQNGKVPSARIPSGDASAVVNTAAPFEDSCLRKKQRLGWGQGLAKYEKAKVEGPDETIGKGGLIPCSNNNRIAHGPGPSLSDKSPRITGLSECASPATPSSVACSSSPGVDDKSYDKVVDIDNDMCNLSDSPAQGFQNCLEEFSVSLENLELSPLNNLTSILADLVQAEDASSGDSCFVRSTATNKLLLLKSNILKAIEKTEYEIDLFDNELKSLNSELVIGGSCLRGPDSLQVISAPKHCKKVCDASNVLPTSAPLQVASSGDVLKEKPMIHNDTLLDVCAGVGDMDIESPGTSTSKFVELPSAENPDSSAELSKNEESSIVLEVVSSTTAGGQCLLSSDEKKLATSVSGAEEANHLEINTNAQISNDLSPYSGTECKLLSSIFTSNKDTARKAFEVFNKLLPSEAEQHQVDIWGASCAFSLQNRVLVKEKLATRKCFLRFKERILTLKFRAFQHLWKEDMCLLSRRKSRPKSQRRFELSSRVSHNGHQKNRSSIRSRFTSPGNLTLVPTTEIMDFASKLLSDSQIKLYRNSLKMPALILDEKERRLSRFVTTNGLVEDPCAVEKEKSMINPWTSKEKEIFMEVLAMFGKDFRKIASFLEHKTTADCIEFYYKNQKSESFDKIKKKLELRKQERSYPTNTYMVTSGKKWNREVNAASLDMLGAASVIAAQADESMKAHQTCGGKLSWVGFHGYKTSRGDDSAVEGSTSVGILANEKEAAAADVLTGICGALSSEAMSSCVTSSVDPGEGCQEWKSQKLSYRNSRPLTPEVMQLVDDEETCSDDSCGELDSIDWTDDEKSIFIEALRMYGKDFAKISRCMGTRSRDQCKIFFSKSWKCLGLDVIHPGPSIDGMPVSDTNGGMSDTEDACIVEMESAICSTQSSSRMDVDFPFDMEASANVGITNLPADMDGLIDKKCMGLPEHEGSEKGLGVVAEDVLAVPKCGFDGDIKLMEQVEDKVGAAQGVTLADDAVKVEAALSSEQPVEIHGSLVFTAEIEHGKESTQPSIAPVDEPVSAEGPKGTEGLRLNCAIELHAKPHAAAEHLMCSEITHTTVSENGLDDRNNAKSSADTNSNTSTLCCFPPDSAISKASGSVADRRNLPGFSSTSNVQHQVSLELLPSVHNPQIISWPQKGNCPVSASLALQDSSVIHSEDHTMQPIPPPSSTLNVEEEQGNKQQLKSSNTDAYHQYLLGQSLNQVAASQILRGYPLRVLNKKEMNADIDSKSSGKSSVVHSFSKMNSDQHSHQYFVQDSYNEKCTSSMLPHSVAELPLLPRSREQSSDHPRPHSLSSSPETVESSRRTGDVKLFGQILSHPSTLQKLNPTASYNGDDRGMSPETSGRAFNLKFTPDQGIESASVMSKVDPSKYSGLDDFPMRSYGFWDGNRIQTGLSSLPDSAILLAKYPAAFGDFSTSSHRVEQQPPPIMKRNDRNLGCVSVFPSKDVSSDFQVYRTCDGTKVQPFTVDMKRHDVFSEIQKRNGYEGVAGFQTQGRVVGMNVVGGGILVGGGSCTGVSDPVAAIQMHYATAERYGGGQAGSMREEESWRRGGDIGR
ncbi:uncharacterized protein LOC122649002 isoform X2 [Telopea speciosissima]|uniref:uncharacterized protein LOC122649002 isoform X2 n=1 Tax=Telopea speciosissima TaxID=54955 RepID=UPI001CC47179|nr:uncharacterized protein LOC122649002 isoform X2 [Telopea speciosissima]